MADKADKPNLPDMSISVTMDDGREVMCDVLTIFPVEGKQYIALEPPKEISDDIWLYRFVPVGSEEFNVEGIDDDDEFNSVCDAFSQMVENSELDTILD
ncbi:MAG: DUF1292 domain-containing protein [Catonella sp.]|jgi:uncharacterized protein YrzB (UPF0473 family)|nr:DUF1292 domain-containing protein [Catonella sp.]MDY6357785.1 DUF1292 domain-containing protein [Catonella sp.]